MKKNVVLAILFTLLSIMEGKTQVGMPTNSPLQDAVLDLNTTGTENTNKGLLLPRVVLLSTDNPSPLTAHTAGMFVYNTNTLGSGDTKVTEGIYYNDGSRWYSLNSPDQAWLTSGNANTNAATNFIGTTDNNDFVTILYGAEKNRVTADGKLLVGTTDVPTGGSTAKLILNKSTSGALQLQDGTENLNYILTSDANGVGSWQMPTSKMNVATLSSTGVNIPITSLNTWYYTKSSITLPPGKWLITVHMLLSRSGTPAFANTDEFLWTNATFSNSSTTMAPTTDILTSGNLMGAALYPNAKNGLMNDNLIIQNSGTVNKTYYFIVKMTGRNLTGSGLSKFGGGWPEDYIWYKNIP
ncbi:hypothetical protein HYN56_15300 [Flavobacterium crocinum]|uniref:Uncharacterized protein n=1 Tax=Flavobacterium crocinum TaxID=2183896 RepID=A0A2S1YN73_9FLAO|nr:hypothetical protein [Flavobacterium crocinum]AWK05529.1 hypothetical protein HYN56_15300 [Flavobacterium crocinum]